MMSMTDSFTRCCKKKHSLWLCGAVLICLWVATAYADGIFVNKAEVRLEEDGYHLSASYDISLTPVMQQALSRGIPLHFVGEFSLIRPRWYWLDKDVFYGEQNVKLSYNVLTRQYRIARGALFQNFSNLKDAINILARQSSQPIPVELLNKDESYFTEWVKRDSTLIAKARLRLDNAQLPKLLQVNALSGSDWTLNSEWYEWEISPEEITMSQPADNK